VTAWSSNGRASRKFAIVLLASLPWSCEKPSLEQVETTAAVPVVVETATVGVIRSEIDVTGVVAPAPGAELTIVAPAAARIAQLPVAEGDAVKAGDLLVRFDIPSLTADVAAGRARVSQAQARVQAATANVDRLTSLLDQGVAAPRDVEDATRQRAEAVADVEQAQSAVEAAIALSNRAEVRAPFAGVVAQRLHNPGDLVEPASTDAVLKVINPDRLQVIAAVPAADLPRIRVGAPARVQLPNRAESEAATVLTRAPEVDPATAAGNVRLHFTTRTALTAGTSVQVQIALDERADAVIVPAASIVTDGNDRFAMIVGNDNKARKQPVTTGIVTRTQAEVTSGVKPGDKVIVRGQQALPDGAIVVAESR
jgi:RND family efflux transporter MFP subunit